MLTRYLFLACLVILAPCGVQADDPTKKPDQLVKELTAPRPNGIPRGNPRTPIEITSADELAKAFTDKDAVAAIQKDVDFAKQKLVSFAWAGSGMDRIRAVIVEVKGVKEVAFLFRAGRTKDLRGHVHLFVVDRSVKWRVGDDTGN